MTTTTILTVVEESALAGEIAPPFAATTEHFATLAGPVQVEIAWTGEATLAVGLKCGDAEVERTAETGVTLAMTAPQGRCEILLRGSQQEATVKFEIAYSYENAGHER